MIAIAVHVIILGASGYLSITLSLRDSCDEVVIVIAVHVIILGASGSLGLSRSLCLNHVTKCNLATAAHVISLCDSDSLYL